MSVTDFTTHTHHADLRDYLRILRARRTSVVLVAAIVVLAAMAYSFTRTPVYVSEARVQVKPIALNPTDPFAPQLNMETESQLARGIGVAELAADKVPGPETPEELLEDLEVTVEPDTEILVFTYADTSPARAQRSAQAFAEAYLEDRADQAQEQYADVTDPLQERILRLQDRLDEKEAELTTVVDAGERSQIERDIQVLVNRIAILQEDVGSVALPSQSGQMIQPADRPDAPASPKHAVNLALALVVGAVLGVGTAFVRERLDDRIKGRADLEAQVHAPVLAVVPTIRSWRRQELPVLVTVTDPESPPAEAYRTLRTGLLFDAASQGTRAILVTSAESAEGKTSTTANLGVTLAQAGKQVVLVSADLRRPRLQYFFGREPTRGLTNVLAGEATLHDVLITPPGMPSVRLLGSGPVPGNPAELLSSQLMRSLMTELVGEADFVLIDGAPVLAVADSLAVAQLVDAVLLVADAQSTHRSAVAQAREILTRVNARVVGAVLNNFDPSKAQGYASYAAYRGYGSNGGRTSSEPRGLLKRK
jgi:capsular exopolysaccharide synthesis family protein